MKISYFAAFLAIFLLAPGAHGENSGDEDTAISSRIPDLDTLSSVNDETVPKWAQNAIFYQIYPQTFCDSDGDGVGDLKGIISKLDYVKSLGVDAIWLNPIYESPFRDGGFDITDFCKVAPRYGTNDDAKALFDAAHKLGLKVIMDFVPGQTSIDHPWFKASCDPKPNKYSNRYIWTDSTWLSGDEKYQGMFIQGYCDRDGNYMTSFFWHQPALNYGWGVPDPTKPWQLPTDHPDVQALREEMKKIMRFWLDMGCDGFHCEMANLLVKNDPDKKGALFWQDVRRMLDDNYPDAFIISEWCYPKAAVDAGFHADCTHWMQGFDSLWQSDKSFFNSLGQGDIIKFLSSFEDNYKATLGRGFISISSSNHDMPRINRLGRGKTDLELIYVFMMTMPDIPAIYYGDEIGMRDMPGLGSKEGSYKRSSSRTPMQFDHGKNMGFSTAPEDKLYLPVDPDSDAPCVSSEESDPDSLLNFVRGLIQFRKEHPALSPTAAFEPIYAMPGQYPFIFIRSDGNEFFIVSINPSNDTKTVRIRGELKSTYSLVMGSGTIITSIGGTGMTQIAIRGRSFSIYKLDKQQ
jgi:glycosidase